jgi:cytidylate kinase
MNDDTMAALRVIAIDGPAGSGKSTIGRRLARGQ